MSKGVKRIDNYPNGSSIELLIKCSNSKIYEDNLIELFEIVFKRESYFGTEYFNGDLETMKKLILCTNRSTRSTNGYTICCTIV